VLPRRSPASDRIRKCLQPVTECVVVITACDAGRKFWLTINQGSDTFQQRSFQNPANAGILTTMPPPHEPKPQTLEKLAIDASLYPPPAFDFIEEGLRFTVDKIHGQMTDPNACRHVSGQQLCEGLRELALTKWGLLARTVLSRWNVTSTLDFGRLVFALIEVGQMQRTDEDTLDDFRNVYDFRKAFESGYRIPAAT